MNINDFNISNETVSSCYVAELWYIIMILTVHSFCLPFSPQCRECIVNNAGLSFAVSMLLLCFVVVLAVVVIIVVVFVIITFVIINSVVTIIIIIIIIIMIIITFKRTQMRTGEDLYSCSNSVDVNASVFSSTSET